MCIGYAKEISAWVCDEARSQREVMMDAWSRAFEESDEEVESSLRELSRAPVEKGVPAQCVDFDSFGV